MRFFFTFLILTFLSFSVKANAFSEIFGSEGAAGLQNSKIRSLSYTFQYLTLSGSIGYLGKQLFDSGFMEPLGLVPDTIHNLSPLAYKNPYSINSHNAEILAVKSQSSKLNLINKYKNDLAKQRFSVKSIELRNNSNFSKSLINLKERSYLLEKY
ncbi:MAG: hypothetical protein CMM95_01840 [Rickettsiales bacterium]|nr:hypothetical protein [Rickettsiales bacterium]